jgi:hypothetical protein
MDRLAFERYAAWQAVRAELGRAKDARNKLDQEIQWLTELLGRRRAEQAVGVWPPPREEQT